MDSQTNTVNNLHIDELLAVDESSITTLIDAGVSIIGKIIVTNGRTLLISGTVEGGIESDGSVLVNFGGTVRGSLNVKSLQVAGLIERAKEDDLVQVFGPLILAETAVINCDVTSEGLKTSYGAVMNGSFRPNKISAVKPDVTTNAEEGRTSTATMAVVAA